MQEHLHAFRALVGHRIFNNVLEPVFLHRLQKDRRLVAAGVGEDRLSPWREKPRYKAGEGPGILAFVEYVGGQDEVESPDTADLGRAPVEEHRVRLPTEIGTRVVDGEVEGGFVVVRSQYRRAAGKRDDGGKADAAPEFDGAGAGKVALREVARERQGARPQLGPVGEPLVAVEFLFVDQVVSRDGVRDAVRVAPNPGDRFSKARAAPEVGSQPIQGSSAACVGGCAFLALGCGEGRYAVTPEDVLEGFAGLIPDLARRTEGGVCYVAYPASRAAGGTDLTVEDLDDVEDGNLLGRHREAVSPVRAAAALYHVRPPQLAEDLLEEPLGDALTTGYLGHPERAIALVKRELHQRPYRILALLRKSQDRSPGQGKLTTREDCSRDTQVTTPARCPRAP